MNGISGLAKETAIDVRQACRAGILNGPTIGRAPGFVQANLVVLPKSLAHDFKRFAELNPKPCPVLGITENSSPRLPKLGADLDLRTDLPRYRIWRQGELADEPTDIVDCWRDDFVGFAIGCSFSFEEALLDAGIQLRHIAEQRNVPMFKTNMACHAAGPFKGPMVVSMRPIPNGKIEQAIAITARYPSVHGAPVHVGDPVRIGIRDLGAPDYGDAVSVLPGEQPVFWACGVTPQAAIAAAKPDFAITHAPGCMLVTDLINSELAVH